MSWSTQQLVEFLAGISSCIDESSAMRDAVERAAEALDAEVAAVVQGDTVIASTGFAAGAVPEPELVQVARGETKALSITGIGTCEALCVSLGGPGEGSLIVAGAPGVPFNRDDMSVLRGMARVLSLTVRQLRLIESERGARERSEHEAEVRRAAEAQLAHQALHDALTGLPNRTLLLDRLDRALTAAKRGGTLVAVLFVDLDNFKLINDTLGHRVGDDLLQLVAVRLREAVRLSDRDARLASDTVARFGGDEFVLLAEGLRHHEDSETIAQRVAGQFSEPFTIADEQLFVTASTGVAVSDGCSTPHSLIRDADAAMYHAKERGRARFEVFDDTLRGRLLDRLGREKDLRHALEANELSLYYQPIFGVASGSIIGAEALIRWHHPTRGLVSADQFIPLAEETGLIRQIDRWTVGQACRQLAAWQAAGGPYSHMTLSVNLSARQVEDGVFVDRLASALAESGAPAHLLALEITETVLIENTEAPIAVLSALRRLGPRLVLDDFGTGYSSLSYLQRFPLDAIKLDRAFAHGIAQPGRDREIVAALLHLARVLDLDVVAEGVETAAQFACLKDLGCRFAQGYHLGRPMPVELLEQVVETNRASSPETGIGTPDLPDPRLHHMGGGSPARHTG